MDITAPTIGFVIFTMCPFTYQGQDYAAITLKQIFELSELVHAPDKSAEWLNQTAVIVKQSSAGCSSIKDKLPGRKQWPW